MRYPTVERILAASSVSDQDLLKIMHWIDQEAAEPTEAWELTKLKIPARYRKVSGPVYRGIGVDKFLAAEIKKNKGYYHGGIESWSTDEDTAYRFASDTDADTRVVLTLHPSPQQILLNIGQLLEDEAIRERMEELDPQTWAYIETLDESEVVVQNAKVRVPT